LAAPASARRLPTWASWENAAGRYDRAAVLLKEALAVDEAHGELFGVAVDRLSLVLVTLRDGCPGDARSLLGETTGYIESSGNVAMLPNAREVAAAIAAGLDDAPLAARLAGAADARRQESGMLTSEQEAAMLDVFLARRAPVWATGRGPGSWRPAGRCRSRRASSCCSHSAPADRHPGRPPGDQSGRLRRWARSPTSPTGAATTKRRPSCPIND